jgi:hypothetical protein
MGENVVYGGYPAFRSLEWFGYATPRFPGVILVFFNHRSLRLCTEWLCQVFPYTLFCLAFHLRQTPPTSTTPLVDA